VVVAVSNCEGGEVMNGYGYDDRGSTLDPGLTALALRARARKDETYVFVARQQPAWWRRAWAAANRPLSLLWSGGAGVEEAA